MKKPIRIAQLTDLHLGETEVDVYDSPVRTQFLAAFNILKEQPLDALILTGDIAAVSGEIPAYLWLKKQLKTIKCPIYFCAGNHDIPQNMQTTFDLNPDHFHEEGYYFKAYIQGHLCLFLDSSSYSLPAKQLAWLQQQDDESKEEILLFIHHPPLYCGCNFIDEKYPLKNIPETWEVIRKLKRVNYIFCGHYHTERTIIKEGKTVFLTPSTMLQFDCQVSHFKGLHKNPGWRIIEWNGDTLKTSVDYCILFKDS
ncbi:MAG: hypothetical protein RIT27_819 [Pseudomonadota bacterium]|jgi:Icc protein